jgi:pimeloyl-ACP methyl ester carboxylesterase
MYPGRRPPVTLLVSERVGQFFIDDDRLEYTEYVGRGADSRWVVLLHGQLMPRTMHERLARELAAAGNHVVTLDLLGHGRSDRPIDIKAYSMTAFGEQVVALLDHLGADQAVIGGSSLGANVSLEVAVAAPERVRGLLLEMPVLENGMAAALVAFGPLLFLARALPKTVEAVHQATRAVPRGLVPFWVGFFLDTVGQSPRPLAATLTGVFFGRVAPPAKLRRQITAPALVVGHPFDPIHANADARAVAAELPNAEYAEARNILEWRTDVARLDELAIAFVDQAWSYRAPRRRRVAQ